MRKLKLHMDVAVDGFVAGLHGEQDWLSSWQGEARLMAFEYAFTDASDTILLGRKTADDFTRHWEGVPVGDADHAFAQRMVKTPKVVFSRTLTAHPGKNVTVEHGDLADTVRRLKRQDGKDIIVYGGATLVASLIQERLIDEYTFIVNPTALGQGLRIFSAALPLQLESSVPYGNGVVVNTYRPREL